MNQTAEIVDFALRWRHWGGGSDSDIFVQFGITSTEYFRRLQAILDHGVTTNQDTEVLRELRLICERRIAKDKHGIEAAERRCA